MSPEDEKLTDEEKAKLQESLKEASLDDVHIQGMAQGLEDSEPVMMPVDSSDDLLSAAAVALEFVEGMEIPEGRESPLDAGEAVAGFDALLRKLENLRSDISSLQRGVVGVFAAQLLTFRGKVVELKSRISEEMVERLRMKFFKSFIEATFVDIVDNEFAALEKDLVDKIVEQTQQRFKEFAQRVRESELDLRTTIVEQQDIVRSFMTSLEEDGMSLQTGLAEKDAEIAKLEREIKALQSIVDKTKTADAATEELARKLKEYDDKVEALKQDILKKDASIKARTDELDTVRAEANELRLKYKEAESQLEVYKGEAEAAKTASTKSDAEYEALEAKLALVDKALEEKRAEADKSQAAILELQRQAESLVKERESAEAESQSRLDELNAIQDKIKGIKEMEQQIYDLDAELKTTQDKIPKLEMQKEAFEKATRLMEKERDLALEQRDISDERVKRYIDVLNQESNTKVLILVDEVGSIAIADLAKTLAQPVGLVTKWVRQYDKLGVLKIKGDKAVSTLRELKIKEGEVEVE
jgi:chromosome segregation ATPase